MSIDEDPIGMTQPSTTGQPPDQDSFPSKVAEKPCPNCGYCPACGRSNWPPVPWYDPDSPPYKIDWGSVSAQPTTTGTDPQIGENTCGNN